MTDIPSWLQVVLATLSLVTAAAAWKAANKSAKAATQSDQTAAAMLWLEKERRHDELSPSNNGIQVAIVTNQTSKDMKVEISIEESHSYILCCRYTSLDNSVFDIATNKEIASSHEFGWGSFDNYCKLKDGEKVLCGTLTLKFWPNSFKCECGVEQRYRDDNTRPHWTLEKYVECTSADLTNLPTYGNAGIAAGEYRFIL